MALIPARHDVFGKCLVPEARVRLHPEWTALSERDPVEGPYDPAEHTVDEVLEYLATASESEQNRVLAAERDGKARKTVLDTED